MSWAPSLLPQRTKIFHRAWARGIRRDKETYVPMANPFLVHWTLPCMLPTLHLSRMSWPSRTVWLMGRSTKYWPAPPSYDCDASRRPGKKESKKIVDYVIQCGVSYWLHQFFSRSSRIRVDLLSYESKTTVKQEQYDFRAEKKLDGKFQFLAASFFPPEKWLTFTIEIVNLCELLSCYRRYYLKWVDHGAYTPYTANKC